MKFLHGNATDWGKNDPKEKGDKNNYGYFNKIQGHYVSKHQRNVR